MSKHEIEWIAMSDRAPKYEEHVLTCYLDCNDDTDGISIGVRYLNEDGWNNYGADTEDETITHWMTLPELPKKPAPATLLDRIKAEYGEYDVTALNRSECSDLVMSCPGLPLHTAAQSMMGFYRYVYEKDSGHFFTDTLPVQLGKKGTYTPVAVLFTK